jgi:YHS domain-containing protein
MALEHRHHPPHEPGTGAHVATDPVCGMRVDPHRTPHRHEHGGRTWYFCSAGCRAKFAADPDRYLAGEAASPEAVRPETVYTCPMLPEVRQIGPGSCPICGMALEPLSPSADAGPNPELADMQRRFKIGLVLTLPVLVLEMGPHLTGLHLLGRQAVNGLQLLLATPVVLWAGWPVLRPRLGVADQPQPQHVHADRARDRRRLALQRGRHRGAGHLPCGLSRRRRLGRGLFRGGFGDHGPRAPGPGA